MARYFGTVQGGRGRASRLGHSTTGLYVTAQSHSGDVVIELYDKDGDDHVRIGTRQHGNWQCNLLYEGLLAELLDRNSRLRLLKSAIMGAEAMR